MMNTLSYKGYTARIDFDARDEIFVGRVLGVRDIISFHAQTTAELRRAFEFAVDDFLSDCAGQGIAPEKPASGRLMLRIPPEVHLAATITAQASGKSLNQWVAEVLAKAVHA
jgi:predicted HicB family RNase H-like nuclease